MRTDETISVRRVASESDRSLALEVMRTIYRDEKAWIADDQKLVASSDLTEPNVSWFVASKGDRPVGVVRVLYEPPLGLYAQYGFRMMDPKFDLDAFIRRSRIAEIGRFAVVPDQRRNLLVAASLMRSASRETFELGFSHYITDVFEGEKHSPYEFHTRVMGFLPVATHDVGELNCRNRRITLVLDMRAAYFRLRAANGWLFRHLTEDWPEELHRKLTGELDDKRELVGA